MLPIVYHILTIKKHPGLSNLRCFPIRVLVKVIFGLELLNTTAAVDELLLTCKERMAR